MKIEKTMLIGELIHMDELIPQMLMGAGMHCLGCPASQAESLEEACMVHGIDCDDLVSTREHVRVKTRCKKPSAVKCKLKSTLQQAVFAFNLQKHS